MVKKKKISPKSRGAQSIQPTQGSFFMGLTKPQTQSLAVGIIVAGIGLFALAGIAYNKRHNITKSILPDGAATTMLSQFEITPTPTELTISGDTASQSSEIQKAQVTPTTSSGNVISKLPNTSSKVTYTVKENDSLATIGEALCKSDRAWQSIVGTNNLLYPFTIHPGETYIITCQ